MDKIYAVVISGDCDSVSYEHFYKTRESAMKKAGELAQNEYDSSIKKNNVRITKYDSGYAVEDVFCSVWYTVREITVEE